MAKKSTERLHALFNSGAYDTIYDEAGPALRNSVSERDFDQRLAEVHDKLGVIHSSILRSQLIKVHSGQRVTVALAYDVTFANGQAKERLVWEVVSGSALLSELTIN